MIDNKIKSGLLPGYEDMSSPLTEVCLKCGVFDLKDPPTVPKLCKTLTELVAEAFIQPDCALNSTVQFPLFQALEVESRFAIEFHPLWGQVLLFWLFQP